jgi:hypothetical protein
MGIVGITRDFPEMTRKNDSDKMLIACPHPIADGDKPFSPVVTLHIDPCIRSNVPHVLCMIYPGFSDRCPQLVALVHSATRVIHITRMRCDIKALYGHGD